MNANLYALLRGHFAENLDQPCILIPGGPVIHYDDLDAASARIAHMLLASGCVPGDRVAVQTDKSWQVLALYLACLRAGQQQIATQRIVENGGALADDADAAAQVVQGIRP